MMCLLIVGILLLSTWAFGHAPALFVLHDAGETLALLPVVRRLQQAALVLPLGEPAMSMVFCRGPFSIDCKPVPSVTLQDLGIDFRVRDGTEGRGQLLPLSVLQHLASQLAARVAAVITGMNFAMQYQIGNSLKDRRCKFAVFYDGLSVVGTDADAVQANQSVFAQSADEVWLASLILKPNGSAWIHPGTSWYAVGQPTLESWRNLSKDVDTLRDARVQIYGEAALVSAAPAIVWFGGYGATYAESLRTWVRAATKLHALQNSSKLLFSLAVHPGPFEDDRRVLREEGAEHLIKIVPSNVSGALAALSSNLTVSQGSTGGEQSVFVGKPALFVDTNGDAFGRKLGALLGLIRTVRTASEAMAAVDNVAAEGWTCDPTKLAQAGVPLNSTDQIIHRVQLLLGSSQEGHPKELWW